MLDRRDDWLQPLVSAPHLALRPDWQAGWLGMPAWHFIPGFRC